MLNQHSASWYKSIGQYGYQQTIGSKWWRFNTGVYVNFGISAAQAQMDRFQILYPTTEIASTLETLDDIRRFELPSASVPPLLWPLAMAKYMNDLINEHPAHTTILKAYTYSIGGPCYHKSGDQGTWERRFGAENEDGYIHAGLKRRSTRGAPFGDLTWIWHHFRYHIAEGLYFSNFGPSGAWDKVGIIMVPMKYYMGSADVALDNMFRVATDIHGNYMEWEWTMFNEHREVGRWSGFAESISGLVLPVEGSNQLRVVEM
jgi:hypothetical protein